MPTYLDAILAFHRERARGDARRPDDLERAVANAAPVRSFSQAIAEGRATSGIAVIAEVKRRSPSRGDLAVDLNPADLSLAYAAGGAACLSVLTDAPHFGGSPDDLIAARTASGLPTLRKDFTVAPADLYDARAMSADAVLLIVAALDDGELVDFLRVGAELELGCLVEVHDEIELARALDAGAAMIGVNQRDLRTFEVDTQRARRLAAAIPSDVVTVAESGIRTRDDVAGLIDAGFHAILVGEALVTSPDPRAAIGALLAATPAPANQG